MRRQAVFNPLKNYLGILLLLVYVGSTTEFYQLFKTPLLVVHYWEHSVQGERMGLLDFMTMHYFNGDLRDEDYERDMQLPFKTFLSQPDIGVSLPVPPITLMLKLPCMASQTAPVFGYLSPALKPHTASIWQPPRQV